MCAHAKERLPPSPGVLGFQLPGTQSDLPVRKECDYVEELRELMAESVRIRLESEVPLGAFLSGGIDSTAVVALMARELGRPVKTFSIGFSDAHFDELSYARVAARHLETEHHEFVVTPDVCKLVEEVLWHYDEPFADVSSIPTYVVSKMAREHVSVVLTGDGGDELFAGYDRYLVDDRRRGFDYIPECHSQGFAPAEPRLAAIGLRQEFFAQHVLGSLCPLCGQPLLFQRGRKEISAVGREWTATWELQLCRRLHQTIRSACFDRAFGSSALSDSKTYLPGDILTKVDRMTMAHSVEARAPLLDHKLIEFVQTIPASLKMRGHRDQEYPETGGNGPGSKGDH